MRRWPVDMPSWATTDVLQVGFCGRPARLNTRRPSNLILATPQRIPMGCREYRGYWGRKHEALAEIDRPHQLDQILCHRSSDTSSEILTSRRGFRDVFKHQPRTSWYRLGSVSRESVCAACERLQCSGHQLRNCPVADHLSLCVHGCTFEHVHYFWFLDFGTRGPQLPSNGNCGFGPQDMWANACDVLSVFRLEP